MYQQQSYTVKDAVTDGWKGDLAPRFVAYRNAVDEEVIKLIGIGYDDLPDVFDLASAFMRGRNEKPIPPHVAAKKIVAAARRELGL